MLGEVERYQPPEPAPAEIDARVAETEARVGSPDAVSRSMAATGMTPDRLRQVRSGRPQIDDVSEPAVRDVLATVRRRDPAAYREHPSEFTVGGQLQPYEAVAAVDPRASRTEPSGDVDRRLDGVAAETRRRHRALRGEVVVGCRAEALRYDSIPPPWVCRLP